MIRNALLASRFLNRPLAMLESQSVLLLDMIRSGTQPAALSPELDERDAGHKPYQVVAAVAIISIRGCLVHGAGWYWWGYSTAYDQIRAAIAAAINDDTVKAIALLIDSPGGECAGCYDLVDALFAMRGTKPVHAIVDEAAYSAAYAIASAADRIWVPRTGGVGSIGIIWQHTSIAGALEKAGVEVETFTYGAFKADGYPERKLSENAAKRIQGDIDTLGELFVDTVARNRGLAAGKIRDMQAATFMGTAGVAAGLVDEVSSADAAFMAILDLVA